MLQTKGRLCDSFLCVHTVNVYVWVCVRGEHFTVSFHANSWGSICSWSPTLSLNLFSHCIQMKPWARHAHRKETPHISYLLTCTDKYMQFLWWTCTVNTIQWARLLFLINLTASPSVKITSMGRNAWQGRYTHTYTQIKINLGDMATDTNKACYIAQGLAAILSTDLETWQYESCVLGTLNNTGVIWPTEICTIICCLS